MRATGAAPRAGLVAWVVGVVVAGLYLSTLTATPSSDALGFASWVEKTVATGTWVTHPQHVLHQPTGAVVLGLLHAAGLQVGGLLVLQVLGAIGGAACAGLLTWQLARARVPVPLAAATALALALAGGVWFFATVGIGHAIASAFGVAALGPCVAILDGTADRRTQVLAGILLALAAGYHLTLGTLWIALVLTAAVEGGRTLRRVVPCLGLASLLLGVVYAWRAWELVRRGTPPDSFDLFTFHGYTVNSNYLLASGFSPLAELRAALDGFARAPDDVPRLWTWLAWTLPVAWLVAAVVRSWPARAPDRLVRLSAAWFACSLLLFACWSHADYEFTSFLLVPLAASGAAALSRLLGGSPQRAWAAAALTLLAGLGAGWLNWTAVIRPKLDPSRNADLQDALMVERVTRPGDLVVTGFTPLVRKMYTVYFGERPVLAPDFTWSPLLPPGEPLRRFTSKIEAARQRGARVYAYPEIVEPGREPDPGFPLHAYREAVAALHPVPAVTAPDGAVRLYVLPPLTGTP